MYLNTFKTFSKKLKQAADYKTLAQSQVTAANLLGFSSVNATTASLPKASGKFKQKDFVEELNLPEKFEYLDSKHRTESTIFDRDSYDNAIELLSNMLAIIEEDDDKSCFSILVNNEEFVVYNIEYSMDEGFTVFAFSAAKALLQGSVYANAQDGFNSFKYIDHASYELAMNRNSFKLVVDAEYTKTVSLDGDTLKALSFNSDVLSSVSRSEDARLNSVVKTMQENFNAFTYNDLIKISRGVADQPLLITNESAVDGECLVCDGIDMIEGVLVISTYLVSYDEHVEWIKHHNKQNIEYVNRTLHWKEAVELLKQQPKHLIEEPVRFFINNDYMLKQYVVPIGVEARFPVVYHEDEKETFIGKFKLVKPKAA